MNEEVNFIDDDIPAYKKKSKKKGQPRSKHKHEYETVLLQQDWHMTDFKTGKPKMIQYLTPTKVCVVCGRIDCADKTSSYYKEGYATLFGYSKEGLSEKALALPKWHSDFFDKFAIKMEDENDDS